MILFGFGYIFNTLLSQSPHLESTGTHRSGAVWMEKIEPGNLSSVPGFLTCMTLSRLRFTLPGSLYTIGNKILPCPRAQIPHKMLQGLIREVIWNICEPKIKVLSIIQDTTHFFLPALLWARQLCLPCLLSSIHLAVGGWLNCYSHSPPSLHLRNSIRFRLLRDLNPTMSDRFWIHLLNAFLQAPVTVSTK